MKNFLNDLRERLVADLKSVSKSNFTVATDIGEEREKIFRKFLNDIFPYYDAFKGNVFGESCDFVLADKHYHPRFNTKSLNSDRYYQVICSLVDTVIDLKGMANSQQIEKGIEQATKIKAFSKKEAFFSILTSGSDNKFFGFYEKRLIKHVLVFINGSSKNYLDYVYKNVSKNLSSLNNEAAFKKILDLPDALLFLESNSFLIKRYMPKHPSRCFMYLELAGNCDPIFGFLYLIESWKTTVGDLRLNFFANLLENKSVPSYPINVNNIFFDGENISENYIKEKLGIVEKSNF